MFGMRSSLYTVSTRSAAASLGDVTYGLLAVSGEVDHADCALSFTTGPVPDELVARLHLVAVTRDERIVVCRAAPGWRSRTRCR